MPKTGTSPSKSECRCRAPRRRRPTRPAGQDDRLRTREHLRDGHRVGHDLGVDPRLPHPPRDQLRVLRPEVDDEDEVMVRQVGHSVALRRRAAETQSYRWSLLMASPAGSSRARLDEPGLVGQDDGVHAVAYAELGRRSGSRGSSRSPRDVELGGDLRVRVSACDQRHDLGLAGVNALRIVGLAESGRGRRT